MPLNPLLEGNAINQWIQSAEQYYYPWDIPGEIIQGAVRELIDAGERHRELFPPHIEILIDAQEKTVKVRDNGRGFEEFRDLGMNRSRHDEVTRSGFGIGLSAILARSDYFEINTAFLGDESLEQNAVSFSEYWDKLRNARNDQILGKEVNMDKFNEKKVPDPVDLEEPGTIVTAKGTTGFEALWRTLEEQGGEYIVDSLFCHTALGYTGGIFGDVIPDISYYVSMIDSDGIETIREGERLEFLQITPEDGPIHIIHPAREASEGEASRQHFYQYKLRGRTSSEFEGNPVISIFGMCAIGAEQGTNDLSGEEKLQQNFPHFISSDNDISRIFLSIDGFLQPFRVPPPSGGGNLNVDNWYFAIVNVDRNVVEQGRNAITAVYMSHIAQKVRDMLLSFDRNYRGLSRGVEEEDHQVNTQEILDHINVNPLPSIPRTRITSEDDNSSEVSVPYEPVLLGIPAREAEVVVAFADLCSGDVIEGTKIASVGDNTTPYDLCLQFTFPISSCGINFQNYLQHICRRRGVIEYDPELEFRNYYPIINAEVKKSVSELSEELNGVTRKNISQIDLVVAWESGRNITGWELRRQTVIEMIHPQAYWRLESTSDRHNSSEVILLSDFFPDSVEES
ncbi:ATP-binding protein [Euryarchaeota archaeon]|nr:ATP-binding protein [Euryarchaeota archaeon]